MDDNGLIVKWLGRVRFDNTWTAQETLVQQKSEVDLPDELWLLEHDPVYTIGRTPDQSSLRDATQLPHPLFQINRGGQATYHGPGQLVGYPILDLRRHGQDLHRHLRRIEEVLIEFLKHRGIPATRRDGLTGVWIENRKVASIGVGVRRWISMHGFALNVTGDLAPFQEITPCGISGVTMTSVEAETGTPQNVEEIAHEIGALFPAVYTRTL